MLPTLIRKLSPSDHPLLPTSRFSKDHRTFSLPSIRKIITYFIFLAAFLCIVPVIIYDDYLSDYDKIQELSAKYNCPIETVNEFSQDFGKHIFCRISQSRGKGVPNYVVPKAQTNKNDNTNEKYLTWLPHSNLELQHTALENALLLARYTNRTLIIPPAILGRSNPWRVFSKLYNSTINTHKNNNLHCTFYAGDSSSAVPDSCKQINEWTLVEWDSLYGRLKSFMEEQHIRSVFTRNVSIEWIMANTGAKAEDLHYFKDGVHYGAKIYDDNRSRTPLGRFIAKLDLDNLKQVPHKVIYFESLAGADRVLHELSDNNNWYQKMTSELVFTYPGILSTANRIISKLGNPNKYLGIHVRLSDSYYRGEQDTTVRTIIKSMESLSGVQSFTARPLEMIYMATEIKRSRTVKVFRDLYERFGCIRTLNDFKDELSNLDLIRNSAFDDIPMKHFLIPIVDMVVVARGRAFVGTPDSSFSEHARRLYRVFWKWDLENKWNAYVDSDVEAIKFYTGNNGAGENGGESIGEGEDTVDNLEKNINVADNDVTKPGPGDSTLLMDDDQLWVYASTLSTAKPIEESATPSNAETASI
ncbi:11315_t:CDS:2 [Paraglomus occultum]|uniref:11315_t:CDS:1 n=1 Tax=Paraglomus occultum TaxID=144539 RepID=A0A9N9AA01_9GLOM|nr:11315_t:CDS:2 [Paraglomus occultum]